MNLFPSMETLRYLGEVGGQVWTNMLFLPAP